MRSGEGVVESTVIRLQPVFDDPDEVRSLVEGAGPFATLALAAQTKEEQVRSGEIRVPFVPPWFRRDLATHGEVHVAGGELLQQTVFIEGGEPGRTLRTPS